MTHWYEGPLAALRLRATGPDAEEDRLVTAAVVVQDLAGRARGCCAGWSARG